MERTNTAVWYPNAGTSGRWQINVTNDHGIRKTFTCSATGRKGQLECNRKADAWLAGTSLNAVPLRGSDAVAQWLDHVKLTTQGANYRQHASIAKLYILPEIGMKKFDKLTRHDFQKIINDAFAAGKSKKYLSNIRGSIINLLKFHDRTESITIPSGASVRTRSILQPDDLYILFTDDSSGMVRSSSEWYIHLFRFAVLTGLRPGELMALTWPCIDEHTLRVRGSINYTGEHTNGKNRNAIRDEPLSSIASSVLEDQKQLLLSRDIISPYVFPDPSGRPSVQMCVGDHLKAYCTVHNITPVTMYELRHTYISVMAGLGNLSLAELKTVVGHSKNMDTLGVYGHALLEENLRIAGKIDDAFSFLKK